MKKLLRKVPGLVYVARKLGLAQEPSQSRRFLLEMLPKGSVGAEIGVHMGDFSARILDIVQPRELNLIDPWEHQDAEEYQNAWYGGQAKNGQQEMDGRFARVRERFSAQIDSGTVRIHRAYSDVALERFPDDYLDWVYIDGNHLYDFVKKDIALSLRKVKPGGLVTGDDYTGGGWWAGGVKRAVDEVVSQRGARLVELKNRQFVFLRE